MEETTANDEKEQSFVPLSEISAELRALAVDLGLDPEKITRNTFKKLSKGKLKKKDNKPNFAAMQQSAQSTPAPEQEKKVDIVIPVDETPVGEKKRLIPMPDAYFPTYVESAWQSWWERSNFYSSDPSTATNVPPSSKFIMVMPPPNVTGSLHLGHALMVAVEDTLTRYHRMKGHVTLWVPGTDHAGIATQTVVEKQLKKTEGISRHDLGREAFIHRIWDWKNQYGNRITQQLRLLSSSCDWSREAFTLDAKLSRAVNWAFCTLYKRGLIYREKRLVNWSCALKSAISDIEVESIDLSGSTMLTVPGSGKRKTYEFGLLMSFKYPIITRAEYLDNDNDKEEDAMVVINGQGYRKTNRTITVSTTRLETMLGDTAVAVNSHDPRYTDLLNGLDVCWHPICNRIIPLIVDDVLVDMSFGTGAVKVTPAHDANDYACGVRNGLKVLNILTPDGCIVSGVEADEIGIPPQYQGMFRYDARLAILADLTSRDLFVSSVSHAQVLGLCSRSDDVIEPIVTPQWFVKCDSMAKAALDAVVGPEASLSLFPSEYKTVWRHWLENIKDWCISRQLWWGHRIPAYRVFIADVNVGWIVAMSMDEACVLAREEYHDDNVRLEQDEDVLDTWFSSSLFPFSVFGWPDVTDDFNAFYPTSCLETGSDILFFWVARMVMMGLELTGKLPFTSILLHAIVRDKSGHKMSKSLGNVIDPLEVMYGCSLESLYAKVDASNLSIKEIEGAKKQFKADFPNGIPECGSDALRFGLLNYMGQSRDINLDVARIVGWRNFCNKLWNVTKLFLTAKSSCRRMCGRTRAGLFGSNSYHNHNRHGWILSKLLMLIESSEAAYSSFDFGLLSQGLYDFLVKDLCDVYIELVKPSLRTADDDDDEDKQVSVLVLERCLVIGLKLLHPIMPLVTEELYQRIHDGDTGSIMLSAFPVASDVEISSSSLAISQMQLILDVISSVRSMKAAYGIASSAKIERIILVTTDDEVGRQLASQEDDIKTLARVTNIEFSSSSSSIASSVRIISQSLSVHLPLAGLIDPQVEIDKSTKKLNGVRNQLRLLTIKMADEGYSRVPANVQEDDADKMSKLIAEEKAIVDVMSNLEMILTSSK